VDLADPLGDFLGGMRGLGGELLDLGGDDRTVLAATA